MCENLPTTSAMPTPSNAECESAATRPCGPAKCERTAPGNPGRTTACTLHPACTMRLIDAARAIFFSKISLSSHKKKKKKSARIAVTVVTVVEYTPLFNTEYELINPRTLWQLMRPGATVPTTAVLASTSTVPLFGLRRNHKSVSRYNLCWYSCSLCIFSQQSKQTHTSFGTAVLHVFILQL
jgi:hypothetical protein